MAVRTAANRSPAKASSTSWANTSVSVSLVKRCPSAARAVFRSAKFSKMPLWTTTTSLLQSVCGCAFCSVGRPCVAQRVWAIPTKPGALEPASFSMRVESFPALRWIVKWPLQSVAIPAES